MNIVLLSGGSGKRLWPLSNDMQSKQFLKLLKNEKGEYESMVQRVVRQIRASQPEAQVFVSCNKEHSSMIDRQLQGSIEVVAEPSRRDTFPAICLAAAYLKHVKEVDDNASFVVCPIDVFAEKKYFELLSEVERLTEKYTIGLMGAIPTYPSEKYGYILTQDGKASGFVEKPDINRAEAMIARGALWNCGVFGLRIGYVLEKAKKYVSTDSFQSLFEGYSNLPSISIDYEVVEKEKSIGTIVYDGKWKDLGTWNTLTEEMSGNSIGTGVIISESCKNTHVLNMLNIPVIALDTNDLAIIVSHDGILVSSKHGSSFLKPIAEKLIMRPMYEEKHWGSYRVLDLKQNGAHTSQVKRVRVDVGQTLTSDTECETTWIVIRGKGILTACGEDSVVSAGSVIQLPKAGGNSLLAATELEFIEVKLGEQAL